MRLIALLRRESRPESRDVEAGGVPNRGRDRRHRPISVARVVGFAALALTSLAVATPTLIRSVSPTPRIEVVSPEKDDPAPIDPHVIRSFLEIKRADSPRPIAILKQSEGPAIGVSGLVAREIGRQALLIAARDELGAVTHDLMIGDPLVEGPTNSVVEWTARPFDYSTLPAAELARVDRAERAVLWKQASTEKPEADGPLNLSRFVTRVEALSRKEFREALKRAGLPSRIPTPRSGDRLPADTEARLGELHVFAQYALIRELHQAIREGGQSPALLGALARAYANLGVLTEQQWSPAHAVYKARALLYAERLVALEPSSVSGLCHRAYVRALIGLHADALADLESAGLAETRPGWAKVIAAYCRFDTTSLADVPEDAPEGNLAGLLGYLAVETPYVTSADPSMSPLAMMHRAADVAVKRNPDCYRVYDGLGLAEGASNLEAVIEHAVARYPAMDAHIEKMKGIPKEIGAALKANDAVKFLDILRESAKFSPESGEPSWGALARILKEIWFLHIEQKLTLHARILKTYSPYQEWEFYRKWASNHPFLPYVESLTHSYDEYAKPLTRLDPANLQFFQLPAARVVYHLDREKGKQFLAQIHHSQGDRVAWDLSGRISATEDEELKETLADQLLEVSPYSPLARAVLISQAWDRVKDQAKEWERDGSGHPLVLAALGRHYYEDEKRLEDGERLLRAYIKQSQDLWACYYFAKIEKSRGDMDSWKETMRAIVEQEHDRFGRAGAAVELADYYAGEKNWDEARTYAERSVNLTLDAAWALLCAARIEEGAENWDQAEAWIRRYADTYNWWAEWFLWCKRTGHGDLDAATAQVLGNVREQVRGGNLGASQDLAILLVLAKQPDEAYALLKRDNPNWSAFAGVFLALLADERGDTALRDASLQRVVTDPTSRHFFTARVCEMILESGRPKAPPLDLAAIDRLLNEMGDAKGNVVYAVGHILLSRGEKDDALKYLGYSAKTPASTSNKVRVLALEKLRELGVHPDEIVVLPNID